MRAFTASAVVSALALSACAPTDPGVPAPAMTAGPQQCFLIRQVENFRQGRSEQIFLRVGREEVYELSGGGGCSDLNFTISLALIPDMGQSSGSRLCTGDWARIVVPGPTTPGSICRVRVMRKLTAEQVAALPSYQRP